VQLLCTRVYTNVPTSGEGIEMHVQTIMSIVLSCRQETQSIIFLFSCLAVETLEITAAHTTKLLTRNTAKERCSAQCLTNCKQP